MTMSRVRSRVDAAGAVGDRHERRAAAARARAMVCSSVALGLVGLGREELEREGAPGGEQIADPGHPARLPAGHEPPPPPRRHCPQRPPVARRLPPPAPSSPAARPRRHPAAPPSSPRRPPPTSPAAPPVVTPPPAPVVTPPPAPVVTRRPPVSHPDRDADRIGTESAPWSHRPLRRRPSAAGATSPWLIGENGRRPGSGPEWAMALAASVGVGGAVSVAEVALAGEDHGQAVLVGGGDDLLVADRAGRAA